MTNADTLLLERLTHDAEADPRRFTSWELDRLEEWADRTDLSPKQIAILTRIDLEKA